MTIPKFTRPVDAKSYVEGFLTSTNNNADAVYRAFRKCLDEASETEEIIHYQVILLALAEITGRPEFRGVV